MTANPTPLAEGFSRLREATLAQPAPVWVPSVLHALIMAIFARIFGRLEDLIALWQSGLLPPLESPRSRTATPREDSAPRARTPSAEWPLYEPLYEPQYWPSHSTPEPCSAEPCPAAPEWSQVGAHPASSVSRARAQRDVVHAPHDVARTRACAHHLAPAIPVAHRPPGSTAMRRARCQHPTRPRPSHGPPSIILSRSIQPASADAHARPFYSVIVIK